MILLTSRLQGICNLSKVGRTATILLSTCLCDSGSVRHAIKTNSLGEISVVLLQHLASR
jgi:hypothetical protein